LPTEQIISNFYQKLTATLTQKKPTNKIELITSDENYLECTRVENTQQLNCIIIDY
jgi:23S rRNA G2445 N2-methylase RlmL